MSHVMAVLKVPIDMATTTIRVVVTTPPLSWVIELARISLHRFLDFLMTVVARVTKRPAKDSVYLKGAHRPQPSEVSVFDAPVTGKMPADLVGMFVNITPNPHTYLPVGGYHIFDGDGSLTSCRVHADGRASFAYTHLDTELRAYEHGRGRTDKLSLQAFEGYSGVALALLNDMKRKFEAKHSLSTANTNIEIHAGRVYALWEGDLPYELRLTDDGAALQTKRQLKFDGYQGFFSAHPLIHPPTGYWYAVSYAVDRADRDAAIVVLDDNAQFVRAVPIHLGRKPMIHDAAITDRYVVVLDLPLLFVPEQMMKPNGSFLRSHGEQRARIGLFPVNALHEDEIIWFDVPNCVSFHTLNAYDTDDGVVLHLVQFPDVCVMTFNGMEDTVLMRYELNVAAGTVERSVEDMEIVRDFGARTFIEFPVVNSRVVSKRAKYTFGSVYTAVEGQAYFRTKGIFKYNLENRVAERGIELPGYGLGEVAFVERKDATSEDDGYILCFLHDADGNTKMNVYDAWTMDENPLATVHAPRGFHVPGGFHSQFIDVETLSKL